MTHAPRAARRLWAALALAVALAGTATAQVTLEHAAGTTELAEPATRVVALEWTYAEDLLAVGVQPVGVADVAGYEAWVNVEPELGDEVVDVGTRQEPSLEAILALEPDLIVGVAFRHEPILGELEAIAPTLLFDPYPGAEGPTQLEEMESTLRTIATAVGRADAADEVLEGTRAAYDAARARLEEAGRIGDEVLLAQAFSVQGSPQIRVFTDNAMAMGILREIGLENAWPGEFGTYGYDTIDLEGLVPVADADAFLYVAQSNDDPFTGALADDAIWTNLPFVQAGEAHALGGDTWLFGGPLSARLVAEVVADRLSD